MTMLGLLTLLSTLPASADDWTPSAEVQTAIRMLSAYDGGPSCAQVEAGLSSPAADLQSIVEHVRMPQWAPMRAASCLLENHAVEAEPFIRTWVEDDALKGLGRMAMVKLPELPEAVAIDLGRRALVGPVAEHARRAVTEDPRPAVRALVPAE